MATQDELVNTFRTFNRLARQQYQAADYAGAQTNYVNAVNVYNNLDSKNLYADELNYTREIMGIPAADISTSAGVDSLGSTSAATEMNLSGNPTQEQADAIRDNQGSQANLEAAKQNMPSKWDNFIGDTFSNAGPIGSSLSVANAQLNVFGLGQPGESGRDMTAKPLLNGIQLAGLTLVLTVAVGIGILFYARAI